MVFHADVSVQVCSKYVAKDMFPVVAAAVSSDFFKLMLKEPGSAQMDNSLLTVGPEIGGLFRIDYLIYRYKCVGCMGKVQQGPLALF